MGPSAYHAEMAKDSIVEDRDGVKVVFAGGNVFHLHVEDVDTPEVRRGANKAWERAEAIRLQLNPAYVTPAEKPETDPAASEGEETDGQESAPQGDDPPADKPPAPDAADPPADDPPPAEPEASDDAEDDAEEAELPATDDGVISIGGCEAPLRLIPVDLVLGSLGESQGRVAGLQAQSETRRLHKRVRATDGRCAPIFFTKAPEGDDLHVFGGLRTLAAAINLGMERVAVVILPADRATELQGLCVAMHVASLSPTGEEDEMIYRAYND